MRYQIKLVIKALLLLAVQTLVLNNIYIYNLPIPFLYVVFLIELPFKLDVFWALVIALFYGLLFDVFQNTIGLHTGGCLLIVWLRNYFLGYYLHSKDFSITDFPTPKNLDFLTYLIYVVIMLFSYNTYVLMIEAFSFENIFYLLGRIFSTSVISVIFILIYYQIFQRRYA